MRASTTVAFAETARVLASVARRGGLEVPAFRSPPRLTGARRTLRRHPQGAVVSVVLRGRPFEDVAADMVDGVIAANRLSGAAAARWRPVLTAAVGGASVPPGARRGPPCPPAASAGVPPAAEAGTLPARVLPAVARVAERQTQAA